MSTRARRGAIAAVTLVAALSTTALATAHADDVEAMHQLSPRSAVAAARHGGGTKSPNLVDHGGPVLPSAKLYAIWWGPGSAWPSDTNTGINSFLSGLGGSQYLQIAAQYMRGAGVTASFANSYVDSTTPPAKISTTLVSNEIAKVLGTSTPDANGIYIVFASNFPRPANYCAWHSGATVNGVAIAQAYIPNTTGIAGCDPGNLYNANTYTEGTRSIANVTAHEIMEAVTDKLPGGSTTAWTDSAGSEIGDKCAWTFTGPVQIGADSWQLQEEWSNAATGCVQQ